MNLIAGVDEAGRGPLAGPVVAAAVILDPAFEIKGLDDSKKLSPKRRAGFESEIKQYALAWSVAEATVAEIDELNILHASMLAMRRAIEALTLTPDCALIDGNRVPSELKVNARAVVGGDGIHPEIAAGSILAKEARDRKMLELAKEFPGYGFDQHKGYPTKMHLEMIGSMGITQHHRRSFGPVRRLLSGPDLRVTP